MNIKNIKRWRIIPKIRFVNYRKEFPNMSASCFTEWFYISRSWKGRFISIGIKDRALKLDFRRNWIADLCEGA